VVKHTPRFAISALRIKARQAAFGIRPTSEMGQKL
jgi:hypothetical protein